MVLVQLELRVWLILGTKLMLGAKRVLGTERLLRAHCMLGTEGVSRTQLVLGTQLHLLVVWWVHELLLLVVLGAQ